MSILSELKAEETEMLNALIEKTRKADAVVREYVAFLLTKAGLDSAVHGITADLKNFVELEVPKAVEAAVETADEAVIHEVEKL